MNFVRSLWVCPLCRYAQSHQLVFCPKCPGKMFHKDFPHPLEEGYFRGQGALEKYRDWVRSLGLIPGD